MRALRDRVFAMTSALTMTLCIAACSGDKGKGSSEVASQAATTSSPKVGPPGNDFSKVLPVMYRERCIEKNGKAAECQFLRLLLGVEVTMALDKIQRSKDQRGAKQALAALAMDDDPNIIVAATRVLGNFPDTPGIAEKALPMLLESPWLTVQAAAAQLLRALPDQALAAIGAVWQDNHKDLYPKFSYDEYPDFPAHYATMNFPDYPNAEWFSPLDSDRSIGWWTTDDVDTVTRSLSAKLNVQPLAYQQWVERMSAQSAAAFQSIDQSKQGRVQKLLEEFAKTQNMALLQEVQKLQEAMTAPITAARAVSEKGVDAILPLLVTNEVTERARFYIAEEQAGHVARMILVYPLPDRGRTVIQEAWNLGDYPSAWPAEARQ